MRRRTMRADTRESFVHQRYIQLSRNRSGDTLFSPGIHGNVSLIQPNHLVLRVRDFAGIVTSLVASEIFRALDFISRYVLTSSRTPEYVRITHFQGNENRRRRRVLISSFRRIHGFATKRRICKVELKSQRTCAR